MILFTQFPLEPDSESLTTVDYLKVEQNRNHYILILGFLNQIHFHARLEIEVEESGR